jgi:hypothetical protein
MDTAGLTTTDEHVLDASARRIEALAEEIRRELLLAAEHDLSKSRVINMRKMAERTVHGTPVTVIPYR